MSSHPFFTPKYRIHPILYDVREAAVKQGISLERLAEKSGYGLTTIKDIFRHSNPKLQTIEALANVVGMTITLTEKETSK